MLNIYIVNPKLTNKNERVIAKIPRVETKQNTNNILFLKKKEKYEKKGNKQQMEKKIRMKPNHTNS